MLSFTLTPQLIQLQRILNNKFVNVFAQLNQYSPSIREMIHRYAKISMIGASTRIENAVLTDAEIEWIDTILTQDGKTTAFNSQKIIIENKLSKDRERSIEEVAGCRAMLELIYNEAKDLIPLNETIIRGLHHELMRFYPQAKSYIGKYKTVPNSVIQTNHLTHETQTIFQTADPGPITQAAMRDLVKAYDEAYQNVPWTLPLACELTYRFLAIHPFQDGNGRLGRGLFLLALLQSPDDTIANVAPYLPIDRHIEKRKSEYYAVLNRCSLGKYQQDPAQYKIEYFLKFMIKVLNDALDDIQLYKEKCDAYFKLSESALTVLACFKEHPEIRMSVQQLYEATQLPKRTINRALTTLTRASFIQKYGQGASTRYQLIF